MKEKGRKTGELVFKEAPDFDDPQDGNEYNVYEFAIKAVSGSGERQRSTTVDVTVTVVQEAPPAALTNLAVTTTPGDLSLAVSWDAADGATSYTVRWRESGGDSSSGNEVTVTDTSATITVSDYGDWDVEVQGCKPAVAGRASSRPRRS